MLTVMVVFEISDLLPCFVVLLLGKLSGRSKAVLAILANAFCLSLTRFRTEPFDCLKVAVSVNFTFSRAHHNLRSSSVVLSNSLSKSKHVYKSGGTIPKFIEETNKKTALIQ